MKFEVMVIESERGWEQKITWTWTKTFTSADEAYRYQESVNNKEVDVTPNWSTIAMEPKRIE